MDQRLPVIQEDLRNPSNLVGLEGLWAQWVLEVQVVLVALFGLLVPVDQLRLLIHSYLGDQQDREEE